MTSTETIKYPTLDRAREYGRVAGHFENGDPMHGAVYDQDGFLFRVDGTLLEGALTDEDRARLKKRMDRDAALEAARKAFLDVDPDIDPKLLDKMITSEALNQPTADEGDIDFAAWANGTKTYRYIAVAQAIRKAFNQSPANKGQALEILAEHGIIPPRGGAATIPSQQ